MTPYPFGADANGNPVDPTSTLCGGSTAYGPTWPGDFAAGGVNGNPPCYLRVTSMAFRAANRGIAATTLPFHSTFSGTAPFGVWLYDGNGWFPDPTFPGSGACPGSTVLWAGKLDYWLIGGPPGAKFAPQTLCRFDGVSLSWEVLTLPQATLARLPADPASGAPLGGVTAGGCYAWNDCSFFGSDGIQVHWDGQALSDASGADPATSPWLQGDFTAAVARTDTSGHPFGLAVTKSSFSVPNGAKPLQPQPDGSPPPQLFGSSGGPFAPLSFTPPATAQTNDPYTTDLVAVDADPSGDAWVAGDPTSREPAQAAPAPLLRLGENGTPAPCSGYGANTFTYTSSGSRPDGSYQWTSLSVFPDSGDALAGVNYGQDGVSEPMYNLSGSSEPAIVGAGCGQPPSVTRFQIPDPFYSDQNSAPAIPADLNGFTAAVVANAANDGWAATTDGLLTYGLGQGPPYGQVVNSITKPHLYRYTDGQPSTAPLGDDNELRPNLFTIEPPVYVPAPPTVVSPVTTTTTTQPSRPKTVKLKPAIYAVHSKLRRGRHGRFTLIFEFSIRRPVTIGVQALRRKKVVASSGLRHFTGRRGHLTLRLDRKRWPTRVRFVAPKTPQA